MTERLNDVVCSMPSGSVTVIVIKAVPDWLVSGLTVNVTVVSADVALTI